MFDGRWGRWWSVQFQVLPHGLLMLFNLGDLFGLATWHLLMHWLNIIEYDWMFMSYAAILTYSTLFYSKLYIVMFCKVIVEYDWLDLIHLITAVGTSRFVGLGWGQTPNSDHLFFIEHDDALNISEFLEPFSRFLLEVSKHVFSCYFDLVELCKMLCAVGLRSCPFLWSTSLDAKEVLQ